MERFIIGIDVGGTNLKMMIMNEHLEAVSIKSIPTQEETGRKGFLKASRRMIDELDEMFRTIGVEQPDVAFLVMGLPGIVDKLNNVSLHLPYLEWDGFDPSAELAEHFHCKSMIENDASVNVFGEYVFGENKAENMILLTLGTGVGGGIIINGDVFRGSRNIGGEIGHMVICADGGENFCGKTGPMEAYCSGSAMKRMASEEIDNFPDSVVHSYIKEAGEYDNSMITRGRQAGDLFSIRVMERFNRYLSIGISNIIELFNPELILIGGGVSKAGDFIMKPIRKLVSESVFSAQLCPIEKASLGSDAGMYGACGLAARQSGMLVSSDRM